MQNQQTSGFDSPVPVLSLQKNVCCHYCRKSQYVITCFVHSKRTTNIILETAKELILFYLSNVLNVRLYFANFVYLPMFRLLLLNNKIKTIVLDLIYLLYVYVAEVNVVVCQNIARLIISIVTPTEETKEDTKKEM